MIDGDKFGDQICYIAAVNDEGILEQNLRRSSCVLSGAPLLEMRGAESASIAYNAAMDSRRAEIYVFAHQDVYLPAKWEQNLFTTIAMLERVDPEWAVLGVAGISQDGGFAGRVWSTGMRTELVSGGNLPVRATSLDELLIVLRRRPGIRFDEALPGFHLYGTDIVQTALKLGSTAYIMSAPVVHNSRPLRSLLGAYERAYRYMAKKWDAQLPLTTPCAVISQSSYPLYRVEVSLRKRRLHRWFSQRRQGVLPPLDPIEVAKTLGYE